MIKMLCQITKILNSQKEPFKAWLEIIRKGEILNLTTTELKKNYNLFEEKSINEFFYVKDKSIEEFLNK